MRFIHTADWHLGRIFHGVYLTEDQSYILDHFVQLVKDTKPDAVFISGDVYDRAVPPPEAVRLLDDVLSRLILDTGTPVVIIAGNHDSPDRLSFGSRILADKGLHVMGHLQTEPEKIEFSDAHGTILIFPVPYVEPVTVQTVYGLEKIHTQNAAISAVLDKIRSMIATQNDRSILIAHAFVQGGEASESERPLSIGGSEMVDANQFSQFGYTALGHLHRPQHMGADNIQYAGSLLKYSFSEADHCKSVSLVEMDGSGQCRVERIQLPVKHDVRRIEGFLKDLVSNAADHGNPQDYLDVMLLDKQPILHAMDKLREIFPNVLQVERPFYQPEGELKRSGTDHLKLSEADLFASFFEQVTNEKLSDEQSKTFAEILDTLRRQERETLA